MDTFLCQTVGTFSTRSVYIAVSAPEFEGTQSRWVRLEFLKATAQTAAVKMTAQSITIHFAEEDSRVGAVKPSSATSVAAQAVAVSNRAQRPKTPFQRMPFVLMGFSIACSEQFSSG